MTDKIEKAIKDTESAFEMWEEDRRCPGEDWSDIHESMDLAIAALKAQDPRVMTLEEVKQHNNQDGCVWFEQPTYDADAAFAIQDEECTEIISPYILGEPINHGYWSNSNYNATWRCWTSRPTEAQREATAWIK